MNIHQISVFLENRTGQLAEIVKLLAENHVDIRALSIAETSDYGLARIRERFTASGLSDREIEDCIRRTSAKLGL